MRILAITPSFFPNIGGVETHVRCVSERLAARGHQLTVLTHADEPSEEQLGDLRVQRLPHANLISTWRAARHYLAASDIVHCHDAYSFLHFYLPSCWLPPKRPVFATFHGYERYPIPLEALKRRRFVQRRVINSLCMGDFICKWYGTNCYAVSYGGVDPVAKPPPLTDEPSAVFIGRLAEDTSLLLYLDALVILRRDFGRHLHLTVVGDGPLRPIAEKYAKAQGLWVKFLGAQPDPRPELEKASIAFVTGYLAIWQALAYKRLVFSIYDNDLKRDYLLGFPQAKQVIVVVDNAGALAEALNHHLADPKAGEEMRARGAQLAAENSWDRVADLYEAMYRAHGYA